jgi:hypothetical protein
MHSPLGDPSSPRGPLGVGAYGGVHLLPSLTLSMSLNIPGGALDGCPSEIYTNLERQSIFSKQLVKTILVALK